MMSGINEFLVNLNKTNHIMYGVVAVVTMSGLGIVIATFIEVLFKVIGIKGERLESHAK